MTRSAVKREIHFDAQPFAIEVVRTFKSPKLPTVLQAICHKVHGPDHVWCFRHGQCIRLVPLQPFARPDPKVELKLAVDAVNALVVPAMPLTLRR